VLRTTIAQRDLATFTLFEESAFHYKNPERIISLHEERVYARTFLHIDLIHQTHLQLLFFFFLVTYLTKTPSSHQFPGLSAASYGRLFEMLKNGFPTSTIQKILKYVKAQNYELTANDYLALLRAYFGQADVPQFSQLIKQLNAENAPVVALPQYWLIQLEVRRRFQIYIHQTGYQIQNT
jgi:hypothetical protein